MVTYQCIAVVPRDTPGVAAAKAANSVAHGLPLPPVHVGYSSARAYARHGLVGRR